MGAPVPPLDEAAQPPEDLLGGRLSVAQADRVGHGSRDRLRLLVVREHCGDLPPGPVCVVIRVDAGHVAHDLAHRPERDAVAIGKAAAAGEERLQQAIGELPGQPRLPDPRRPDDRHQTAALLDDGALVLRDEAAHGVLPPDERRFRPARQGGLLAEEAKRREPPLFERERFERARAHVIPDVTERLLAEQDLSGVGRLLDPLRQVDRVAGSDRLLLAGTLARDHLAGVDADAHLETHAPAALELLVEFLERLLHGLRGTHGAKRVVLVQRRNAEHGHDVVARVLLDRAAVVLEHRAHRVEKAERHAA